VVELPNSAYKPITNTEWIRAQLCKLQKRVHQLLAHGRWFSSGTPASSTTRNGLHDIAEILLKMALSTNIKSNQCCFAHAFCRKIVAIIRG